MMNLFNPLSIYLIGMTAMVILAVVFSLSILYYIKAKNLAPYLHKISLLKAEVTELEAKRESLQAEVAHAEFLVQQGKDAEEWLKKHQEEIENLQQLLIKTREEFEKCNVQKTDLDRQISERQKTLIECEKKAIDAEQRVSEAEKAIENIRKENAELTVNVPKLQTERDNLIKEVNELKIAREKLDTTISKMKEDLDHVRGELERLKGELAAKRSEDIALSSKIGEQKSKIIDLESRANIAQSILSKLDAQREESNYKWKNLDTPIVDESTLRKTDPKYYFEEKTWLGKFEKSLSENGFIFDSRAIRAFHTGLKCSQQTQLVVLAGISGTGKSLLPELYAAALGMNFLPVPVQPRWDSPQDLFGFYNYMEGRYKATELSRLLWQFDWYNGPAKDNAGYRSKITLPLNLVLLDEMNLARVEYYFADLLSKLETRYGLNPDNEAERRKAEIELDCNAADSIKSMRRLFVSPYTLFAGTMNEDESTQSLSDKVIDRANVLRFGRPKMIGDENETRRRKPNKSAFIASYANVPRITAKEWDNWLKPLDIAEEEAEALTFLRRTVSPVAKELDKVYRSFGFRVDDAMKLYVLNYPGTVKEAVADQIEMKILPKLNGIELQDVHFDSVKKALAEAIDSTGDDRLREAFDEAANSDNGTFFKWRGVMR